MNRLARTATSAALLISLPLFAQEQPIDVPKLVETVDVRVINVDVVVTDKKGNVIKGLTKDDFELYENGAPKPISNFYEVEGGLPAGSTVTETGAKLPATDTAAAPVKEEIPESMRRRLIFFIDNLSLNPFNRNKVFSQMKDFAKNVMRPGDEAMVATFNRSLKVRVPFTRDPGAIASMLDTVAGESALGTSNRSERTDVEQRIRDAQSYTDALAAGRTYAESVENDLRQSVESLNGLMTTLAGVEGKKILVLTSEGFQIQPGREIFQFIEEESHEKPSWQNAGSTLLEGMQFDSTPLIQSVARTANANNITMYTIHAGGLGAANENSAENARPISFNVSQAALSNSTDSLQMMAQMTGGIASLQTNNYALAFQRIQKDLDSYYSLGYRGSTERVDRQRQLEVRMKNRNYVARNRQSFVEKSTFAEMSDRVVANLLYKSKANDLKILVKLDPPQPADDDLYKVPVEVQIPMDNLTLIPQGETFAGGFSVYVAVANKDGDMSDVSHQSHQIRVPQSDMAKLKGKYYTYSMQLLMERGLNKLSLGVVDDVSNTTGFAREQIIAQDLR